MLQCCNAAFITFLWYITSNLLFLKSLLTYSIFINPNYLYIGIVHPANEPTLGKQALRPLRSNIVLTFKRSFLFTTANE